jgi:hypothetical protein
MAILMMSERLLTSNLGSVPIVVIIPSSVICLRNRDHPFRTQRILIDDLIDMSKKLSKFAR